MSNVHVLTMLLLVVGTRVLLNIIWQNIIQT